MLSNLTTLTCVALCVAALSWPRTGVASPGGAASWTAADSGHQNGHGKNNGNGKGHGGDKGKEGHAVVADHHAWTDRDHCHLVYVDYYNRHGLPPGLAKKGSLPPGLRKQLHERGHLPPGLEKHMVVLPVALEREFPPLPPYYVRRGIGVDLVVIDTRSNFVVSIMANVFIGH